MNSLLTLLKYAWAAPNTMMGLIVGVMSWPLGAKFAVRGGVIEIYGRGVRMFLNVGIPGIGGVPALTLGHVVLAQDEAVMELWREHERVHVGQYEAWGPLFLFAYAVSAIAAWITGNDPYYENRFELHAYGTVAEPQHVPGIPRRKPQVAALPVVVTALRSGVSTKAA